MPGITRIHIEDPHWNRNNDWRLKLAYDHETLANRLYRWAFSNIGIIIDSEEEVINVGREEAAARYDWAEGIDVILQSGGARMTLQEKFLTFHSSTATFEERKSSGKPGAWYYCTAQYYFVGYTRKYWDTSTRALFKNPIIAFQDWIILDFPAMRRYDAMKLIPFGYNKNRHDHQHASFRFIAFNCIPPPCIIAMKERL